ncbi:pentapeptide repeat-containing protein [Paraclostridium bifermentans]|uniref:Pentapeptide repeat-containing protein n=1 Tax=Paraclostridium bifermentans TaxID=1490 RepID=A0ABY8R1G9_PARBF|nr:pentapeptide repeat-containing protein [Paraclostridium bifermentans]
MFNEEDFGKKGVLDEENFSVIENKDIICSKFIECNFYNIKFKGCRFIGCTFEKCKFEKGGSSFENCSFFKEDSDSLPSLNKCDNFSCHFIKCEIYAKFLNCILSFSIFEDCNIKNTNFEQSDMTNSIIIDSVLNMVIISDCDLCGAKVVNTYIENIEFRDKFQSKLDEKSFFDKIPVRLKTREEYEGIYMVYETIANKFMENSLNNNFSEYYYLCKITQRKTLKIIPKMKSYLYWATCGYGERPMFAIYFSLVLMLIFAIIYLFTGVEVGDNTVNYNIISIKNLTFSKFLYDFNEALSLSIGAFGGVGTINCKPTEVSYILTNLEVLIGVVMMGLGIGTLTRKVVR